MRAGAQHVASCFSGDATGGVAWWKKKVCQPDQGRGPQSERGRILFFSHGDFWTIIMHLLNNRAEVLFVLLSAGAFTQQKMFSKRVFCLRGGEARGGV